MTVLKRVLGVLGAILVCGSCSPTGDGGSPPEADPGLIQLQVSTAPTGTSIATIELRMTGEQISVGEFVPAPGVIVRASMQGDGTLLAIVRSPMFPGKVLGTICVSDRTGLTEQVSATPLQLAAGAPSYGLLNPTALSIVPSAVDGACVPTP